MFKKFVVLNSLIATCLLMTTQGLIVISPAMAETIYRAHGRCKHTSDNSQVFDGYCTMKQKREGDRTVFVVELDNGSHYRFSGLNKNSLQVETYGGIHNVRYNEQPDKGVFHWEDGQFNNKHRLSVKMDSTHPVNVSHDDTKKTSVGTIIAGAAIGALIGGLIGGKHHSSSSNSSNNAQIGQPVDNLASFVGARAGQAEMGIKQQGYKYRRGTQEADSAISYWVEPNTKNCVAIRTTDGRYAAIVYAEKSQCR